MHVSNKIININEVKNNNSLWLTISFWRMEEHQWEASHYFFMTNFLIFWCVQEAAALQSFIIESISKFTLDCFHFQKELFTNICYSEKACHSLCMVIKH